MLAGQMDGQDGGPDLVFEAVGGWPSGEMTRGGACGGSSRAACPGCGSCAGMFTANTMNCLTEALGMGLPGNGTIPAVDAGRIRLAKQAGAQIMKLLEMDLRPRQIITREGYLERPDGGYGPGRQHQLRPPLPGHRPRGGRPTSRSR